MEERFCSARWALLKNEVEERRQVVEMSESSKGREWEHEMRLKS